MPTTYTLTGKMKGISTGEKFTKAGETENHVQLNRLAREGSVVSVPKEMLDAQFTEDAE